MNNKQKNIAVEMRSLHTKGNEDETTTFNREEAYRQTMKHIRKQLPRSTRRFSAFIHIPGVEKFSDLLATTIGRPNALLFGAIFAFVLVLATYAYAKYAGISLQGSETIIAFAAGWLLGIIYDCLCRLFGKRQDQA